jgi:hypothetical protein
MQAIIAGSHIPVVEAQIVIREFEEVVRADRVRQAPRRLLLQVLHSTRALDSSLSSLIKAAGASPGSSLGRMLHQLETTGIHGNQLPAGTAMYFPARVVNVRNRYMHEAGAFPAAQSEIIALLSNMDACLTQSFRLW